MNLPPDKESKPQPPSAGDRLHPQPLNISPVSIDDPLFRQQVQSLHQLTVYARWLFVCLLWISIGSLSLWGLRYPISLLSEYFTWSGLRYSLFFYRWPTLGLAVCIAMTISVLSWQSRNILLGIPENELRKLEQQVQRIRQQGKSHPLWKWVCKS